MAGGDHARCEPQIDVVLVSLAWLKERGATKLDEAVAETRPHDAILNALCPPIRIDVLLHDIPVSVLTLSNRPECRSHWSSDLSVLVERRRRVGHEILPLAVHCSILFVQAQLE